MNIIELAKEADIYVAHLNKPMTDKEVRLSFLERFASLVRADLMKQVMDTCEAEYKLYDAMIEQDDAGHDECCALIHLMRKLDRLRPATGKVEREWVDLTREDMQQIAKDTLGQCNQDVYNAVIAAFKEKNK